MAKSTKDFREELDEFRQRYGTVVLVPCSKEENNQYRQLLKNGESLPKGLFRTEGAGEIDSYEFFKKDESCFSEKEQQEYLAYKKIQLLETIRNCVVFFTILTVLGLIGATIFILNLL